MHKQLKTIINKLGKTPEQETEFYELMNDEDLGIRSIPKATRMLIERSGKNFDDYDKKDLSEFFSAARKRILDYKYESGQYKKTSKTEKLDNLTFEEDMELAALGQDIATVEGDEEREKIMNDQRDYIWKVVNLDKDELTKWEIGLVEDQVLSAAIGTARTALDSDLGNL